MRVTPCQLPDNAKLERPCPLMRVVAIFVVLLICPLVTIIAEEKPDSLAEWVSQLVNQLQTDDKAQRREIESALIELGPQVLPYLTEPNRTQPMGQRVSLERVRRVLQQQKSAASLEESRFTLSGNVTLQELLTQLSHQTKNRLDQSTIPTKLLDKHIQIDFQETSFWEVIDWLEAEFPLHYAELSQFESQDKTDPEVTHLHQGPVRFEFLKPLSKKLIGNDQQLLWRIPVQVYFEPRLRPLYLHWKGNAFKATGFTEQIEKTIELEPYNPDASIELAAESDQGGLKTILDFVGPREEALEKIQLEGSFNLILAAGHEQVEFDLTGSPLPVTKRVGRARVELIELKRATIDLYKETQTAHKEVLRATLDVLYSPQVLNAFESHRTWMFSDPVWIRTAEGNPIPREPLFKTLNQFPGEIVVAYDFEIPPDQQPGSQLIYRIPTLVTTLNLPVQPVLLPTGSSQKK
ncbi:MAG: hypothetical protein KDA65_00885 [Planctomycetaceae bacterium]|nr:hypothetical protein [Planctomycetaceae bacterium]